jgi:hypothetical protein
VEDRPEGAARAPPSAQTFLTKIILGVLVLDAYSKLYLYVASGRPNEVDSAAWVASHVWDSSHLLETLVSFFFASLLENSMYALGVVATARALALTDHLAAPADELAQLPSPAADAREASFSMVATGTVVEKAEPEPLETDSDSSDSDSTASSAPLVSPQPSPRAVEAPAPVAERDPKAPESTPRPTLATVSQLEGLRQVVVALAVASFTKLFVALALVWPYQPLYLTLVTFLVHTSQVVALSALLRCRSALAGTCVLGGWAVKIVVRGLLFFADLAPDLALV